MPLISDKSHHDIEDGERSSGTPQRFCCLSDYVSARLAKLGLDEKKKNEIELGG